MRLARVLLGAVEAKCRYCGGQLEPDSEIARPFFGTDNHGEALDTTWNVQAHCVCCMTGWHYSFDKYGDATYVSLGRDDQPVRSGKATRDTG